MININELIQNGFKIVDGILCDRFCSTIVGCVRVQEYGWSSPCTEYKFDHYDLNDYSIKCNTYGEWYLMRGYQEICRLSYNGGKNWEKY